MVSRGPSINDVTQILGGFGPPPPPCHAFLADHRSKSTQPPLLPHVLENPLPPLERDVIHGWPLTYTNHTFLGIIEQVRTTGIPFKKTVI